MGIFTKVTNWLYGTTPSTPQTKVAPTLLAAGSAKTANAKKPAAKKTTKKSTGKKTKK